MMRRSVLTRAIAPLALAVSLVAPADGEITPPASPEDGLTRETFTDPSTPTHPAAPTHTHTAARTRTKRMRLDSKDFLSVHHTRRHHRTAKKSTQVAAAAATHPPRHRRNPVARFVFWWNGWVIRTFHTKFGTVLLGTVGAES